MRCLAAQHLLPGPGGNVELVPRKGHRKDRRSGVAERETRAVGRRSSRRSGDRHPRSFRSTGTPRRGRSRPSPDRVARRSPPRARACRRSPAAGSDRSPTWHRSSPTTGRPRPAHPAVTTAPSRRRPYPSRVRCRRGSRPGFPAVACCAVPLRRAAPWLPGSDAIAPAMPQLRPSRDHPGRLAQGPDEKCGQLGRIEGFTLFSVGRRADGAGHSIARAGVGHSVA